MRTCFFCGDEIGYNDCGTNQFMVGGWIKPHLKLKSKKVLLHVNIKTESFDDPQICVECLSAVYTRLGKNSGGSIFVTKLSEV